MDVRGLLHDVIQLIGSHCEVFALTKLSDPNFSGDKGELEKMMNQASNLKNQENARYEMYKKTGKI
jgi:hypothetical protein